MNPEKSIVMKKKTFLIILFLASFVFLYGCTKSNPADSEQTEEASSCDHIKTYTSAGDTLDFETIQKTNPDIHAWIEIPGTNVDYPVLQSPSDDEMYLYTAYDGGEDIGGSVFTQASYNAADFNDPVTVLYGNAMWDGTMFGSLQMLYSGESAVKEHEDIIIYLPGETREYTVFAAVPYDDTHILYTYDFTDPYWYDNFFYNVSKIRSIGAYYNETFTPVYGDRVILLSTSLQDGSTDGRFLVMAVLHDDIADTTRDTP